MTFSKLFLASGKPFTYKNMVVKHPTLHDIYSIDISGNMDIEEEYWNIVMSLICDPYDYMVQLYDNGIDYQSIDNFDMFVFNWQKTQEFYLENKEQFDEVQLDAFSKIKQNLSFFLGDHDFNLIQRLQGEYVISDNNNSNYFIDRDMYNAFVDFLKAINNLSFKDRINPADENVKMMLIEDTRDEQEAKKLKAMQKNNNKTKVEILSNMKIAVCSTIGSVGFHNVDNLCIYQLYSLFNMFSSFTRFNNMLGGIYGGMVSSDAFTQKDWDWLNYN